MYIYPEEKTSCSDITVKS